MIQINELGFEHYLYQLPSNPNSEGIGKMLKYSIDQMFYLEGKLTFNLRIIKKTHWLQLDFHQGLYHAGAPFRAI